MQQIIDHKLYDTDDAVCICEYVIPCEEFDDCLALFKTEKGNYFFEGKSELVACSEDEAREYFLGQIDGRKNCYEDYAAEFGDDIERA